MASRLMELYVELSMRGDKDLEKRLTALEKRAGTTEKKLSGVGSGMEAGAKRGQTALGRLQDELDDTGKKADAVSKKSVTLKTSLTGNKQVEAGLDAISRRQENIDGSTVTLKTTLSGSRDVLSEFDRIEGASTRIDGDTVTVTASVKGGEEGRRQIEQLEAAASKIDGDQLTMTAEVKGAASAVGEIAALDRAAAVVDGMDIDIAVDVDAAAAIGTLAAVGTAAAAMDAGLSAGGTKLVAIGGLATVAAALFTPLLGGLASLGSLATAAAAGVGLIATPLAMVVKKISDYKAGLDGAASATASATSAAKGYADAQRGVADAQAAAAKTAADGARAVKDAEQGVTDARRQGASSIADAERNLAQTRKDAASSIADAERGLQDARQSAADGIADAEQSLTDARNELELATYNVTQAQQELNSAMREEPLNQEQATLDLAEARDRVGDATRDYNEAVKEYGQNSEEASDASRNLQQAELDLARQTGETADIRKNGSQELQAAEGAWADSVRSQTDAVQGVQDAEQGLADARSEGARTVADAQRDLAAAQSDAARSVSEGQRAVAEARRSSAQEIADAERGLSEARRDAAAQNAAAQKAIADAQRAAATAAKAAADAQDAADEKTVKLTASQMALLKAWEAFAGRANTAFGPAQEAISRLGVSILQDVTPALAVLGRASTATIGGLGRAWDGFVSRLKMPAQQGSIGTILGITPQAVQQLTAAVGDFGLGLVNVFASAAPGALKLAGWIRGIAEQFRSWSSSTAGVNAVKGAVASAVPVFSSLWNMAKNLFGALVSFGTNNSSSIAQAIDIISWAVGGAIRAFGRFIGAVGPFGVIAAALAPLFVGLVLVFGTVASAVAGILGPVSALVAAFGGWVAVGGALLSALGPIAAVVAGVAVAAVLLYKNWGKVKQALAPLVGIFNKVKAAIGNLGTVIKGLFTGSTGTEQFKKAFASLPGPVQTAVKRIVIAWRSLKTSFQQGWNAIKPILTAVGNGIKKGLGTAFNFLVSQGKQALASFRKNWPAIKQAVLPVLTAIANGIKKGLGAAFKFAVSQAKVVVNWFRKNWPLIQRTTSTVFNALKKIVTTQIKAVLAVVKFVFGGLVKFWKANHTSITNILKAAWNTIKTIVSTVIKVVLGIIKAVMQAITGDWKGAWNTIKNVLSTTWDAIKQLVKNSLTIVKNLIKIAWDVIKTVTSAAWDAVKNYIGDKLQAANERVKTVLGWLKSGLKSAWEAIKSAASEAWTAISGAIWRPVETAYNKVTEFIDKIKGAVNAVLKLVGLPELGSGGSKAPTGKGNTGANTAGGKMGSTGVATGGTYIDGKWSKGPKPYYFARGGIVPQDAVGGVVRGVMPHAVYGEAGSEAYVRLDKKTPESANALYTANEEWAKRGWLPSPERHKEGAGMMARGGLLDTFKRAGVLFAPHGATAWENLWNPRTAQIARETEDATGARPNTYQGHPDGFGERAPYSVDWWGGSGRGDAVGVPLGDKVLDHILTKYAKEMSYWMWNSRASSSALNGAIGADPHSDHVHATFMDGLDLMGGAGGTSGGISVPNPKQVLFEQGWKRLVEPLIDLFLDPLKNADYVLSQAAGAGAQKIPDGIYKWIDEKIPDMIGGGSGTTPSGGGGSADENRALGEKMLASSSTGGSWGSLLELWNRESQFNELADNPDSSAYGIPQAMTSLHNLPQGYGPPGGDPGVQMGWGLNYIKCVPLDTDILTRTGWKRHDEVEVGDETVAYNPETGKSEWTEITEVHHYDEAPVTKLSNTRWQSRSTPNHRWVAEKYMPGKNPHRREEFVRTDGIGSRHRLRLAAELAGDTAELAITEKEAELLGWIMGDGCIQYGKNNRGGKYGKLGVCIYQSKERWMKELRELVGEFPHSEYEAERVHGSGKTTTMFTFRLRSAYARDLLDRSGYEKDLEQMVLDMSPRQRSAFLRGLWMADGYQPKDGSPMLAQNEGPKMDAAALAIYMEGHYGHKTDSGGQKHIHFSKPHIKGGYFQREELELQPVWCVTTELGSWTARQDGQMWLTGNSRYGTTDAALSYHNKYNSYAKGGISKPKLQMPSPVSKAFKTVADALNRMVGGKENGSLRSETGSGQVTSGITAIAGESGKESIVPLERSTPQGEHALRTAMKVHHPEIKMFATGGISGLVAQGKSVWDGLVDSGADGFWRFGPLSPGTLAVTGPLGTTLNQAVWGQMTDNARSAVVAHEWGHRGGFMGHLSAGNLMQPSFLSRGTSNPTTPTAADRNALGGATGLDPDKPPVGTMGDSSRPPSGTTSGGINQTQTGSGRQVSIQTSGGVAAGPKGGAMLRRMGMPGGGFSRMPGLDGLANRLDNIERAVRNPIEIGDKSIGKQAGANYETARGYGGSRENFDNVQGIVKAATRQAVGTGRR